MKKSNSAGRTYRRIYRSSWTCEHEGNCVAWHPSKRSAELGAAEVRRILSDDESFCGVLIERVDVPISKKGLISFLNLTAHRDNG
jgi:hypothetical protein